MKQSKYITVLFFLSFISYFNVNGQSAKAPASCKMYLEGKVMQEITVEDALKWCDLTPPTIQCDNGMVYFIESCQVNFFTMKPLQNKEYGIGEKGIPYMARKAVSEGKPGDALVLKEVSCIDTSGAKINMSVISFKLK